ncbi:DUF6624 domain-containing protein [Croceimicrobium hydrocarbonivorans]|uniref:Uncharacterized protein n=1 Tax=Croceimicrobium hydrocarbonivorans TaxID=2761580 RepID=A0A7H0VIV8_9FLAO|nr:DUF6624 domain-containing protein [Croceimicrobium hydrocarbonivorans]QNR25656.1 hypothetical protein H4K34_07395 [Croceimicrobium hydrocarbonivorans]
MKRRMRNEALKAWAILFLVGGLNLDLRAQDIAVSSSASSAQSEAGQDTNTFSAYLLSARSDAEKGSLEEAFQQLEKAIDKGAGRDLVYYDPAFKELKAKYASELDVLLQRQYQQQYPTAGKAEIGYKIWSWYLDEEQELLPLKSMDQPPTASQMELIREHREERRDALLDLIEQMGWPRNSEVGEKAGEACFFLIQHSPPKILKKCLPLFIEVAMAGEADKAKAALMVDRFLVNKEGLQIFGTQAGRSANSGEGLSQQKLTLYPIADESNLAQRRKVLGLPAIEEYCKQLKVDYVPIEERPDYEPIKLKEKWRKKGYLLGT